MCQHRMSTLDIDAKIPADENFHDFAFHFDQIVSCHTFSLFQYGRVRVRASPLIVKVEFDYFAALIDSAPSRSARPNAPSPAATCAALGDASAARAKSCAYERQRSRTSVTQGRAPATCAKRPPPCRRRPTPA